MTTTRIFGWIGGILSIVYNVPQIIHIYRRKSAADLSASGLGLRILSYLFYLVHGSSIHDPPTLYMTSVIMCMVLIMCAQKYYYNSLPVAAEQAETKKEVEVDLKIFSQDVC